MGKISNLNGFVTKNQPYLQTFFKASFLLHLLLCYNAYIVATPVSRIITAIAVLSGGLLLLTRLTEWREIITSFEGVMLLLLLVSYVLSFAVNINYGWYEGAKYFIWLALLVGGVFWIKRNLSVQYIRREMFILCIIIIVYAVITNIISIVLLFSQYSGFYNAADGNIYLIGFASWGRLYGVYVDPNYGSVVSVMAVLAAVFCITYVKKHILHILFIISMLPSIMFCVFSASRTGKLCFIFGAFVLLFAYFWKRCNRLYALKALLAGTVGALVIFVILTGTLDGYNYISEKLQAQPEIIQQPDAQPGTEQQPDAQPNTSEPLIIGRGDEELGGDISNRRFDIWKSGLDIFKREPILGIGWGNTISYVKDNIPDSYLINNDLNEFDVFHNSFIDVLVNQGIIGAVIFMVFLCGILVNSVREFIRRKYNGGTFAIALSGVGVCTLAGCVLSILIYVNSGISCMFWLFLGYLVYLCKEKDNVLQ